MTVFHDRADAGRQLAHALAASRGDAVVVYGLARGGVVVAAEIARALQAPLDVLIPRKIGHPLEPEYALGAVMEDGQLILDSAEAARVDPAWLDVEIAEQRAEAGRRRRVYLSGRTPAAVAGKTAIVVDDGIATGLTMRLAIQDVRRRGPRRIVVAVPIIPQAARDRLEEIADAVVAVDVPACSLGAVGASYEHFLPVSDAEVIRLLDESAAR